MQFMALLAALLIFLLPLASAQGAAFTVYSKCVDLSGDIVLSNDIETNGTCMNIVADNFVMDCAGHKITGLGASPKQGILVRNHRGVTVKNCIISGFMNGVFLANSSGITLMNNTISGNTVGVRQLESKSNIFSGNAVCGNKAAGFVSENTSGTLASDNKCNRNNASDVSCDSACPQPEGNPSGAPEKCECGILVNNMCAPYECCVNDHCAQNEVCEEKFCKPLPTCECGEFRSHACFKYACCSDANCTSGEICSNSSHACEIPDCGCGRAVDHVCTDYECCSNLQCAESERCVSHSCQKCVKECKSNSDCCEGTCVSGSCVPVPPSGFFWGPKSGCAGLSEACLFNSCILCDLLWLALLGISAVSAWLAWNKYKQHAIAAGAAVIVPLALGGLVYAYCGVLLGLAQILYFVYRNYKGGSGALQEAMDKLEGNKGI